MTSLGDGSLTWTDITSFTSGLSGSNGQIQFNNNGSFGASANLFWDSNNERLGIGTNTPQEKVHVIGSVGVGLNGAGGGIVLHSEQGATDFQYYITAPTNLANSVTFTWPSNFTAADQIIMTDGNGNLQWSTSWAGTAGDCVGQGLEPNNTGDNSASGGDSFIGGGDGNAVTGTGTNGFIGGGVDNVIETGNNDRSTIYGGTSQSIKNDSDNLMLFAGENNTLDVSGSDNTSIIGGKNNEIRNSSENSSIFCGGDSFIDKSFYSLILGGNTNIIDGNDKYYSVIFSGNLNNIRSLYSMVSGKSNYTSGDYSAIFSGRLNNISEVNSIIGSGYNNAVSSLYGVILSGQDNSLESDTDNSAILYGNTNVNEKSSFYTFIGGRNININPGSGKNSAHDCILLGRRSIINNDGDGRFLFADGNDNDLTSGAANEFRARFTNGYRLYTDTDLTLGATIASGASSWASPSDRNLKENIVSLNPLTFLNKIKELDIFSWSYKGFEDKGIRNYGPMAQDFFALFGEDEYGVYGNDTSIKELDAAAIFILGVQGSSIEIENQKEILSENIEKSNLINFKIEELEKRLINLDKKLK